MQQTASYKLNKIEMGDVFSTSPLNENADKMEAALLQTASARAALSQRIAAIENLRVVLGRYQGGTSDEGAVGRVVDLGKRPLAVFVCASASSASINYTGLIVLDGKCSGAVTGATSMELRDNGFWVNDALNSYMEYRFIAFFGDWPLSLQGKND